MLAHFGRAGLIGKVKGGEIVVFDSNYSLEATLNFLQIPVALGILNYVVKSGKMRVS
jgi:hypothetical protein